MDNDQSRPLIDIAAGRLREIALEAKDGDLLGSEDDVIAQLGVSRVTVRQAARVLEREGLLRVRRGANGGCFAARPGADMILAMVCGYLNALGLNPGHTGVVGSALWVEALREAASLGTPSAKAMAQDLRERLARINPEADLLEVASFEQESRSAVFKLIHGEYIELIFRINAAFASQQLQGHATADPAVHHEFVRFWLRAKALEIEAIADGDHHMAMMAGRHNRNLWNARRYRDPSMFALAEQSEVIF